MDKRKYIIACFCLFSLFVSCIRFNSNLVDAATKNKSINYQEKNQKLKIYLVENKINGIILVSSRKNKTPESINNIIPNNDTQQMVTDKRYFPIASLQKLITGIAISKLVMDHKLSWNTHLSKYFSNIKYANHITIWDLMCHQSGIKDIGIIPKQVLYAENQRERFALNNFESTKNKDWYYASSNFCILTAIIQKVTGESYYTYIKKELLYPNGIEHMLPFNEVSDTQKMVLPNYERNKKMKLLKMQLLNNCK